MREQEMRLRVFRFLKARMRNMLMPAAMGIGLAGAGCLAKSAAVYSAPNPSDAALVNRDVRFDDVSPAGPEVPAADGREAATGLDVPGPADSEVANQALATDTADSGLADASADVLMYPETGGVKYMGPTPLDSGAIEAGGDSGGEAGPVIAKYVAPMPDAANDLGLAVRYMAQMPDSGA